MTGFEVCCICARHRVTYVFVCVSNKATPEPGEDPQVTRAKYFIRDEFLVSSSEALCCVYRVASNH